jgi:hypothetical protein
MLLFIPGALIEMACLLFDSTCRFYDTTSYAYYMMAYMMSAKTLGLMFASVGYLFSQRLGKRPEV